MDGVEKYGDDIKEITDLIKTLDQKIRNSTGFKIEYVIGSMLSMMDRFCPYKIGDRVQLTKSYVIEDKNHGWFWAQHFLVEGAKAKVVIRSYDYKVGKFEFYLEFDDETWMSSIDGTKHPPCGKHCFRFTEDWIKPFKECPGSDDGQ